MSSMNKVMLIGNVGKDPEMRFTPNGNAVVDFSVACNSKYKEEETTEWFSITAWNKLAETCNQYVHKGMKIYVEGRLKTETWEDDTGNRRYKVKVIANSVIFLGRKADNGEPVDESPEDLPF